MSDPTGATAGVLYVPGFQRNLNLSPQQTKSRLLAHVDADLNYATPGQFFNGDDVGTSNPSPVTVRVPNSPDGFVDVTRRLGTFKPFADGRFIDNEDLARELEDPTNKVMVAINAGKDRYRDAQIITSALGSYMYQDQNQAYQTGSTLATVGNVLANTDTTAHEGETISAVFNSTSGGYGLTVGKLIEAKNYLDNSELDEMDVNDDSPYRFVCTANQIRDLEMSVPATSTYYTQVQALASGKIGNFMGFRFIRMPTSAVSNPLPKGTAAGLSTNYTRACIAYHPRAIMYRARPIINAHIVQRPDKSFRWYAYYEADHAALRRYDGGVWQVNCDERTTGFT